MKLLRHCVLLFSLTVGTWMTDVLHGEIPAAAGAHGPDATYEVHGVLQSVDLPLRQATIAHENIPGYMPAMTMTFDVHDTADLPALHSGDKLAFRLCVNAQAAWIEQIHATGEVAALPFAPAPASAPPELKIGDSLPDIDLTAASGQILHLHDFRGQALAITFVYARCPLPNYCPLLNQNFRVAQDLLARLGSGDHWHFFSISLDAVHDTPDVLARSAAGYGAEERHWTFVTAPEDQVRRLGRAVGLQFTFSGGQISHNLRTVVVDAAGCIRQIYRGNSWTPQDLAAEVRGAMLGRNKPDPG